MVPLFLGLGSLFGSLFGWIFGIGTSIASVLQAVWPIILKVVNPLWSFARSVWGKLKGFGLGVWNFGRGIWEGVIKPVIQRIAGWVSAVKNFLDTLFGPIFDVIAWINRQLDFVFDTILRPFFLVMDRIRFGLRILASLGIEVAAKIESFLFTIEAAVFRAFEFVRQQVNSIFGWFNFLFDPFGLIRTRLMGWSWTRIAGGALAFLINVGINREALRRTREILGTRIEKRMSFRVLEFRSRRTGRLPSVQQYVVRFRSRGFIG